MERARRGRNWQPSRIVVALAAMAGVIAVGIGAIAVVQGQDATTASPRAEEEAASAPTPETDTVITVGPLDADAKLPAEEDGRRIEPVGGHEGHILLLSERDVWPGSGPSAPQVPVQTDQRFVLWDPESGESKVAWTRTDSYREMVLGVEGDWVVSVPNRGMLMDWQVLLRNLATGETRQIAVHDIRFSVNAASPVLVRYQAAQWGDLTGDALPVMSDGYVTWVQTVIAGDDKVRQRVLLHQIGSKATATVFEVAEPRQLDENGNWTSGGHAWSASVGGGRVAWVYQASPDEPARLLLHDIASGETRTVDLPQEPAGVAVSGTGARLAVNVEGGVLLVWPETGEIELAAGVSDLPAGHRVYFEESYLWWRPPPPTPQSAGVLDVESGRTWVTDTPTHNALVVGHWFTWQERGADGRPRFYHFVRLGN